MKAKLLQQLLLLGWGIDDLVSGISPGCHRPVNKKNSVHYSSSSCRNNGSRCVGSTVAAFISTGSRTHNDLGRFNESYRTPSLLGASSSSNNNDEFSQSSTKNKQRIRKFSSPQISAYTKQQICNIFGSSVGSGFVPLSLAGKCSYRKSTIRGDTDSNEDKELPYIETILLSSPDQCQDIANEYESFLKSKEEPATLDQQPQSTMKALPIPLSPSTSSAAIKLLSQAYCNQPLSKSLLLSLNSLFLNRDNGLFDNLPWSTWSIDPNLNERDAANNILDPKYTLGKRVAYQRFMGKDWQGRSLSLGNLANRVKYLLERDDDDGDYNEYDDDEDDGIVVDMNDEDAIMSLSQRLLQLEMKEAQMDIAECEQRLAIAKTQSSETIIESSNSSDNEENDAERQLERARERLQTAQISFEELTTAMQSTSSDDDDTSFFSFSFPWENYNKEKTGTNKKKSNNKTQTLLIAVLDKLTEQTNPPPFRGAIGYPAKLDTKEEVFVESVLPYTSPYELLLEILDEQLNSEIMACVLEPTSLLEGNLVLGGAILLKRKGVKKSTTLSGEVVSYIDDDDDVGNEGVLPRSMYIVECFTDEAIGMAIASGAPVFVEEEICQRAGSVLVNLDVDTAASVKMEYCDTDNSSVKDIETLSFVNRVPPIRPVDESYFTTRLEGERISTENESNQVRIPMTTNPQIFGDDQVPRASSSTRSTSVFSTFNPVKSLDEYDDLSNDAKARLLLKLESFRGILPRPRAVRTSMYTATNNEYEDGTSPPSLLDDILLPLIDESVRRQYLIRDAERRKDFKEADALRAEVSSRQVALENAQMAREAGQEDEALRLEEEAELYKALRADVTQDEGAYNRYLDRDDWYERETQARIKRIDKSKFGTLLDGVDLP